MTPNGYAMMRERADPKRRGHTRHLADRAYFDSWSTASPGSVC